jgi:hypothetical protein
MKQRGKANNREIFNLLNSEIIFTQWVLEDTLRNNILEVPDSKLCHLGRFLSSPADFTALTMENAIS